MAMGQPSPWATQQESIARCQHAIHYAACVRGSVSGMLRHLATGAPYTSSQDVERRRNYVKISIPNRKIPNRIR